jgi:hypothetical protein
MEQNLKVSQGEQIDKSLKPVQSDWRVPRLNGAASQDSRIAPPVGGLATKVAARKEQR